MLTCWYNAKLHCQHIGTYKNECPDQLARVRHLFGPYCVCMCVCSVICTSVLNRSFPVEYVLYGRATRSQFYFLFVICIRREMEVFFLYLVVIID